ncbi:carboxymuconolactone decarboxylase family protein [Klebsiella electrica]|uniref:carboxymuconolactone decarboxylase family protein n=1 Tax=Klebsiella electrica TaxID=1259973 RepID=UPI003F76294D
MDKVNLTRENLAALAPKLASLSEEVLFGDIWQRPALSPRDRSLITLSALVAMYRPEQLAWHLWHLKFARANGVTESEITELFTHLSFYAGWPAAVSALNVFSQPDTE